MQVLCVQLLVGLVDEDHTVIAQAKAASAVLVDPTTDTETIGRKAVGLAITPVPDAAGAVARTEFVPEQTSGTDA
ncbi:hypothetical protein D3C72_2153160 [compost metagenome]